jgi:hypothetical protein
MMQTVATIDAALTASLRMLDWGDQIRHADTEDFLEFADLVEKYTQERGAAMRNALSAIQKAKDSVQSFLQSPIASAADRAFVQEKMLRLKDLRPQFLQQDAAIQKLIQQQLKNTRESSAKFNQNAGVIRQYLGLKR